MSLTRRSVAKGAAWAAPTIAMGVAAPAMAASAPQCPAASCYQPVVSTTATVATITDNVGTVTLTAPPPPSPTGFGFLVTCSGFVSAGIATLDNAVLTMRNRQSGVSTNYPADLNFAVGVAAGVLGATAVYASGVLTFPGIPFPNGLYAGLGPLDTSPVYPTRLCLTLSFPISLFVGGPTVTCSHQVCYQPTFISATVGSIGTFSHDGAVTYGTSWVAA